MARIVVVGLLALLAGCSRIPARDADDSFPPVSGVTGKVDRSVFLSDPGHARFRARYETATVDQNLTGMIGSLSPGVEVIVFYGPWCSDSWHHVPVFLRIAEKAGIPDERIQYVALDRSKKSRDGLEKPYGIESVPTFVFLRGGKEIGRIVESPRTTLEGDIVAILAGAAPRGEVRKADRPLPSGG